MVEVAEKAESVVMVLDEMDLPWRAGVAKEAGKAKVETFAGAETGTDEGRRWSGVRKVREELGTRSTDRKSKMSAAVEDEGVFVVVFAVCAVGWLVSAITSSRAVCGRR